MTSLETLIESYAENKSLAEDYKKIVETQNKDIKKMMEDQQLDYAFSEHYTIHYYISTRESMNEERLLALLKREDISACIKTIEVVDMDALEEMLYNGELSASIIAEMNDCREVKKVANIKLSKRKDI